MNTTMNKLTALITIIIFLTSAVAVAAVNGNQYGKAITGSAITNSADNGDEDADNSDSSETNDDSDTEDDTEDIDTELADQAKAIANRVSNAVAARTGQANGSDNNSENNTNVRPWSGGVMNSIARRVRNMIRNPEAQGLINSLSQGKAQLLENLDRARLRECLDEPEECRERMQEWTLKQVKVKEFIRAREISSEKLEDARNRYVRAKSNYQDAVEHQLRARERFLEIKQELQECEEQDIECEQLRQDVLEKAKQNLESLIERIIQYQEKLKAKIMSSENMNEEEAEQAIQEIDEKLAELKELQEKLENVETQEEFQKIADQLRDDWQDVHYTALKQSEEVIYGAVNGILSRSTLLEKKIEQTMQRLEENGINTSELEEELDEFSQRVDNAREQIKQADDEFRKAKQLRAEGDNEGAKQALENAKSLSREAHEYLKQAYQKLMNMVRMINQRGAGFSPEELDENELVEVVQEAEADEDNQE